MVCSVGDSWHGAKPKKRPMSLRKTATSPSSPTSPYSTANGSRGKMETGPSRGIGEADLGKRWRYSSQARSKEDMAQHKYSVPGMDPANAEQVAQTLQQRLVATTDLHLTLKHVHWNVVGPNFIAVHEMIDPQVDLVREYSDAIAERLAALDVVYDGVISDHRKAFEEAEELDDVTHDMLVGQSQGLELFQWFIRAH